MKARHFYLTFLDFINKFIEKDVNWVVINYCIARMRKASGNVCRISNLQIFRLLEGILIFDIPLCKTKCFTCNSCNK